jgi:hypothetical protein
MLSLLHAVAVMSKFTIATAEPEWDVLSIESRPKPA